MIYNFLNLFYIHENKPYEIIVDFVTLNISKPFYARFLNKCASFAQISVITVERGALEWQEKP